MLISLTILRALTSQNIQVFGDGLQVWDWVFVDDHVDAILSLAAQGRIGETYNIGAQCMKTNLEVVLAICERLDALAARPDDKPHSVAITHVIDRPDHDRRYSIDTTKVKTELGWTPSTTFEDELTKRLTWYLENLAWCDQMVHDRAHFPRLGLRSNPQSYVYGSALQDRNSHS